MAMEVSEANVREIIVRIKHPAIDRTLIDLGIVKSVVVKGGKVMITMAFPFPDIPIGDYLVNSVREPLEKLGVGVDVEITVMDHDERKKFMAMEQESWKGVT